MTAADAGSCSPDFLVVLGPVDAKLTPTGRVKRTRAEIQAEAAHKRDERQAKRERKAADRLAKKRTDAAAKQLRADARQKRSQAATMKRIERDRKRRAAADKRDGIGQQKMVPKPETPRHVYAERLQDDPGMAFSNHVVDPNRDGEDAIVDFLDEQRATVPVHRPAQPTLEETLLQKALDGTADLADLIALIALDSNNEKDVEGIINGLLFPEEDDSCSWDDLYFTEEEDYFWTAYSDEVNDTSERAPRWNDEHQPTRTGRRGFNIKIVRQRCPNSGKVVAEVAKPKLRNSKDTLLAAK